MPTPSAILETRATLSVPTHDRSPVEHAVAESIASAFEPETFICITFHRPDGGARQRYAWTDGGAELGDRIDREALATGLDAADTFHITDLHIQTSHRGRIRIDAHPLRPILADVLARVRCPEDRRAALNRFLEYAAHHNGQTTPRTPRWMGVGPTLLARRTP